MSTLKRVLSPKDKRKQTVPEDATKLKELTLGDQPGKVSEFILTEDTLYVTRPDNQLWPRIAAPLRNVVWAEVTGDDLKLSLLARKKKNDRLYLVHIQGAVSTDKKEEAKNFTEAVMDVSYKSVKRGRHLLVLVNPKSGPGKSVTSFHKKIEPLFKAAHCTTDVICTSFIHVNPIAITTHHKHALEIVKTLSLDKYDAIVTVSGDGLVHEVLNGLAVHENPMQALKTPIAPIPTGSGNALALNLLGIEEGFDVFAAALNAAKGVPMPVDIFSMTQGDNRILSFVSQAMGLMAELDVDTEHLRFIGDTRFMYGFLRGVVQHKKCPVKVSIKVVEADKQKMFDNFHSTRAESLRNLHSPEVQSSATHSDAATGTSSSLPSLQHKDEPTGDGWITFEEPICYLYAGKGPYVGRDFMQFPVSHPDDGCIDVVIQEVIPRKDMLSMIDGANEGRTFWAANQRYFKAEAYRVETHTPHSSLSIDGERYPFEPYQVEVHPKLATWLSPYGAYHAEFTHTTLKD
ncbi:ATP-NAD kinase-like domain-containing protein [Irpex rosettiformis]|uniref:ATP-NAD kinase-like domain-containing protein n=1 Tax=Irpex rosettiformis TaxID=378272 RepID=A0ACB8UID0_9APHY|nr:ATP-NAD kinase-like domain-containing protein [Irpex rosettiformis]